MGGNPEGPHQQHAEFCRQPGQPAGDPACRRAQTSRHLHVSLGRPWAGARQGPQGPMSLCSCLQWTVLCVCPLLASMHSFKPGKPLAPCWSPLPLPPNPAPQGGRSQPLPALQPCADLPRRPPPASKSLAV